MTRTMIDSRAARRAGFILIKMLVVIVIIAIPAAILFPVFAQAREKARATTCVSNLKQISIAMLQYGQGYDELLFPYRTKVPGGNPFLAQDPLHVTGSAANRQFFDVLLNPYIKNYGVFACPSNPKAWVGIDSTCNPAVGDDLQWSSGGGTMSSADGCIYGGENSYGINKYAFQPYKPLTFAQFPSPATTLIMVVSDDYDVLPRYVDENGNQVVTGILKGDDTLTASAGHSFNPEAYIPYWTYIGSSDYDATDINAGSPATDGKYPCSAPVTTAITTLGASRHQGRVNILWADGHVKSMDYFLCIDDLKLILTAPSH